MIKAIVFDFFGVIGQSTWVLIHEEYQTTKEQDRQYKELCKALDYGYISLDEFIKSYAEVLGVSYEEFYRVYNDPSKRFGASKKILEYIDKLRKEYKIALLSNIVKEAALEFIEPIKEHFDVVVTSYQTKLAKPEVAIYELCAKKLGLDTSECAMIDDRQENCEGAVTAGMQAILFTDLKSLKESLAKLLADSNN